MLPKLNNPNPTTLEKPKSAHEHNVRTESRVDESQPRGESHLSSMAKKAYDRITGNSNHEDVGEEEEEYYDVDAGKNYNLSSKQRQHGNDPLSAHLSTREDTGAAHNRSTSEGVEVALVDETGASTTARPAKEGEIYANYTYSSMVDPVITSKDVAMSQRNVKNLERNHRLADQGAEPKLQNAHESSTPNQYEEYPEVSKGSSAQGIVLGSNTPFYDLNATGKDAAAKDSHLEYQRGVSANAKSHETSTAAGSAANTHNTHAFSNAAPHYDSAATSNENYGKYHIPGTKSEGVDTIPQSHDHYHDSAATSNENYGKYHIPGTKSEGVDTIPHSHDHHHDKSGGQQYAGDATDSANTNRDVASDSEIHVKDRFAAQPLGAALTQLDNQGLSNKGKMEHIESNDVMKTSAVDELQSNKTASSANQQAESAAGTGIVAGIIDYLGFHEEGEGKEKVQTLSQEHREFSTNEVPGGFARGYNDVTTGENVHAIKSDILKKTPENQTDIPTTHSKSFDTYGETSNLGAPNSNFDRKSKLNTLAAGAAQPVDHVEDPTAPSIDISHHNTDQYAHNLPKMISEDLTFQGGNMPAGAIPVPLDTKTKTKAPATANKDILADAHTESTPYRFVQDKPEDFRLTKKDAHALATDKSVEESSGKFPTGYVNEPTESTPYRFVQKNSQDERLTQKNASGLATDKSATETTDSQFDSTPYRFVQNKPQDDRLTRKDATGLTTDKDISLSQDHHPLHTSGISAPFNVKKSSVNPREFNTSQNTATAFATTPSNIFHEHEHEQVHNKNHSGSIGTHQVDDKLAGANTESTPYSYVHASDKDTRLTKLNADELKLNKEQPSTNILGATHSSKHKQVKGNDSIETSKPFISAKNIDSSKNISGLRNENDASSTAAIIDPSDFKKRTTERDVDVNYFSRDPYANYTDQYDDFYEGHDQDLANARNKQKSSVDADYSGKKADTSPVHHKSTSANEPSNQDSYLINRFNSAKHEKESSHTNAKDDGEQHGVVGKVKKLFKKDSDHSQQHQQHQQQQQNYNQESALNDPTHRVEAIGAASAAAGAGAASTSGTAKKTNDSSFGGVPTSSEIKRQTVEAPNTHTQATNKPHSSLVGGNSSKNTGKLLNTHQSRDTNNDEQFANFTTNEKDNAGNFNVSGSKQQPEFSKTDEYAAKDARSGVKAGKAFDDDFKDTKTEPSYIATHPDIDTTTPSNAYNPNKALGFDPNTYAATGAIVSNASQGNDADVTKSKSLDSTGDKEIGSYNDKQASRLSPDNTRNLHQGSDIGDSTVKDVIHGEIPKKSLQKEGVDFKHSLKSMLPGENKSKNQKAEKTPEGKTIINERGTVYTETHQDMAKPEYVNQETKTYTLPKTSESNQDEQGTVEGFSEGDLVDHHPADEDLHAQQNHKKGLLNRIKDKISN